MAEMNAEAKKSDTKKSEGLLGKVLGQAVSFFEPPRRPDEWVALRNEHEKFAKSIPRYPSDELLNDDRDYIVDLRKRICNMAAKYPELMEPGMKVAIRDLGLLAKVEREYADPSAWEHLTPEQREIDVRFREIGAPKIKTQ